MAAADREEAVKRRQADAPPTRLAMVFAGIAEQLYDAGSVDEVLVRIAEAAVSTVAGCRMASVTLADRSGYRTVAATDSAAMAVDSAQYQAQEGPCLDAVDAPMVYAQSFPDRRWPRLAARPTESGVQSALSYQLTPAGGGSGAADVGGGSLNSYGVHPFAFSDTAQEIGFASRRSVPGRIVARRQRADALRASPVVDGWHSVPLWAYPPDYASRRMIHSPLKAYSVPSQRRFRPPLRTVCDIMNPGRTFCPAHVQVRQREARTVVTEQRRTGRHARPSIPKAYSFGFITGAFFLVSWAGQFIFQLIVQRNESEQHGQPFTWSEYLPQFFSSTLENWQSEFLQLVWQAAGLAMFYFWGSSQSKEGEDRVEAKIDRLLQEINVDPTEFDYQESESASAEESPRRSS